MRPVEPGCAMAIVYLAMMSVDRQDFVGLVMPTNISFTNPRVYV